MGDLDVTEGMGFFNSNFLHYSTKKLIELISEFSEVIKSIHKKSITFLNNDKPSERERNNPIYNYIKKNIISRNNFNQELERPAHKKLKYTDEEIEEDTNKWKDIPHL